ncbi:MAG: polyprenol monophosphomannose synthase [Chloroflexi bacterium]|nr:polyprenol monophosphomannose synthase [Chloroflexota bacterium]
MKTVVVVPTYNEAANLPALAQRLFALGLPNMDLLVVDDASPDGTAAVAEALSPFYGGHIHVLARPGKEGLGPAYVAGFRWALEEKADLVVQMDADLSHPPEAVPLLLEGLRIWDVVIGSRYVRGGGVGGRWRWGRRLLSRLGDRYVQVVLGLRVQDTKSGFKGFRRSVLEAVALDAFRSKGFIFQAEMAYRAQRLRFRVREVPFIFRDRKAGQSKMSLAIITEALWRPFQIRWLRPGQKQAPKMP